MIIIVSFALSGSVMNTIPSGCQEDFLHRGLVDIDFLFAKRCQRRSLRYLHSVVLWYTPLAFTLVRRLFRNLG